MSQVNVSPTIRDRIRGKEVGACMVEFVIDEITLYDSEGDAFKHGYWRAIAEEAAKHLPSRAPAPSRPVMSDEEAQRFEKKKVNGGKGEYGHLSYGECPMWLLELKNKGGEELAAYLRSERGQRRQSE